MSDNKTSPIDTTGDVSSRHKCANSSQFSAPQTVGYQSRTSNRRYGRHD